MFRENQNTTDAIIGLIKTLPDAEQKKIQKTLAKEKVKVSKTKDAQKDYAKRVKEFLAFARKNKLNLPENFKFNREEAHERI